MSDKAAILCRSITAAKREAKLPPEFTLSQLAAIREALATVIDDGDPKATVSITNREWLFYDSDSTEQIDRRMRFADAVQEILTRNQIEAEKRDRLLALMP